MHTYYIEDGITHPDGSKLSACDCAGCKHFTVCLEQKMNGTVYHSYTNICNSALNILSKFGLMAMSIGSTITINALLEKYI